MRFKQLQEGYKVLPPIDRERYPEVPGLEGPFRTLSGAVVYYDPKEGSYYDKDRDVYLSYDEFRELDNDYSGMKDERDIPVEEVKDASPEEEEKFHSELDRLVHKTFGKRKEEK